MSTVMMDPMVPGLAGQAVPPSRFGGSVVGPSAPPMWDTDIRTSQDYGVAAQLPQQQQQQQFYRQPVRGRPSSDRRSFGERRGSAKEGDEGKRGGDGGRSASASPIEADGRAPAAAAAAAAADPVESKTRVSHDRFEVEAQKIDDANDELQRFRELRESLMRGD